MTAMGSVGLMALFMVDFADLYFLSLLGKTEITSAIGFAGMIAFANLSISLGISIAAAALVAQNLGAGRAADARRYASHVAAVTVAVSVVIAVLTFTFGRDILSFMGARGAALDHGTDYLKVVSFGFPLLGLSICQSFILRAVADPKRAMYVTLIAAFGNGVLDPIFIFGLDLGIRGAALATVFANAMSMAIGFYGVHVLHRFYQMPRWRVLRGDLGAIGAIALPATMTQLATPFAIGFLTWATAPFGDEAVAGTAVVNRLVPVAFGMIFSLSGAVGPIVGQNFGAGNFARLRETLHKSLLFNGLYCGLVAAVLFVLRHDIPGWFKLRGDAVEIVVFFCTFVAISWGFAGLQYVAQAAFNNLGKASWSMLLNWGKATVGTIPFVLVGAHVWGAIGIVAGYGIGAVVFGLLATATVYWHVSRLETKLEMKVAGE